MGGSDSGGSGAGAVVMLLNIQAMSGSDSGGSGVGAVVMLVVGWFGDCWRWQWWCSRGKVGGGVGSGEGSVSGCQWWQRWW